VIQIRICGSPFNHRPDIFLLWLLLSLLPLLPPGPDLDLFMEYLVPFQDQHVVEEKRDAADRSVRVRIKAESNSVSKN
jgi:hypothetical protein